MASKKKPLMTYANEVDREKLKILADEDTTTSSKWLLKQIRDAWRGRYGSQTPDEVNSNAEDGYYHDS